jgi:opacity protein-like surface antigen
VKKACFTAVIMLALASTAAAAQARNIELIDVPTANTMIKGEVRVDIKMYPGGGILSRLYVGLFDKLMIGGAFNVRNIIGEGSVTFDLPPQFLGKIRITDDEGAVPAIAVGYEGQGYMDVPAKGAFLSLTKEVNAGIIMQLTGTVYTSNFTHFGQDINAGAGAAFAVTREFVLSAEYDGIIGKEHGHINLGAGYFFDPIEIDMGIKYGTGGQTDRLARILKILYISYF